MTTDSDVVKFRFQAKQRLVSRSKG
jgi:hypothetical protein